MLERGSGKEWPDWARCCEYHQGRLSWSLLFDFSIIWMSINQAQQATRAMLRRMNKNHEPKGEEDGSDDPEEGAKPAKGKGRGRPRPRQKQNRKQRAKRKQSQNQRVRPSLRQAMTVRRRKSHKSRSRPPRSEPGALPRKSRPPRAAQMKPHQSAKDPRRRRHAAPSRLGSGRPARPIRSRFITPARTNARKERTRC